VQRFLHRLEVERRCSPHTLTGYRRDLDTLLAACAGAGIGAWRELRADHLREAMARAHSKGLSPRSLQRRLSAWRSLFAYLIEQGVLRASPALGLRAPKAARKLPQVLDADEAAQLVELPAEDAQGRRDRAMLELFYSSALRLSELCALRWRDVDLSEGLVRVHGKGGKLRVVPIGTQARAALEALRGDGATLDAPIFRGRGDKPIAARTVQQRLRRLAQRQGLWKRVHPHLLRHSCASHLLESSGDLRAVQELLGHADIGTTQIYTHLDFQHLARVYDSAHPRARRKRGSREA